MSKFIGRYLFFGFVYINVTRYLSEIDNDYYYIFPDVASEGWWLDSDKFYKLLDSGDFVWIDNYNPMLPKMFLPEFRFCDKK